MAWSESSDDFSVALAAALKNSWIDFEPLDAEREIGFNFGMLF